MSNIFEQAMNDVQGTEEKYLGPTYPYYKNIRSPSEIGMSDKGTIQQMTKNINGLIAYVELMVSGSGKASSTGKPLGNQFFLETGAKCYADDQCTNESDSSTCPQVTRYIYINNIPQGNIPFISSGLGENFKEFRGLIPGTMSNLNVLNPMSLLRSFMIGSNPPCKKIEMPTMTNDNISGTESQYVAYSDIQSMDPCLFLDKKNPITLQSCRESFQSDISPQMMNIWNKYKQSKKQYNDECKYHKKYGNDHLWLFIFSTMMILFVLMIVLYIAFS